MNYENKYLKYKNKYITLKKQIGGWKCPHCDTENKENKICKLCYEYENFKEFCTCHYCDFKRKNINRVPEYEIFRVDPIVGRCYEYAFATSKRNGRYYTTEPYTYVGKFESQHFKGDDDSQDIWNIFNNNGTYTRVDYDYGGNLCFREVPCKS